MILNIVCILSNFLVESRKSSKCEGIADRVDCSSGVVNLTRQSCENRGWYVFDDEALTYVFFVLTLKPHTAVGMTTCATTMWRVFR